MSGAGGVPSRPVAVLFDWDGTLVDSWPTIHESMNRTLEAMGHERWSFDQTLVRVRRSLREAFPDLFGDRWQEARDVFYGHYRAVHLEKLEVMEAAEDLLRAIAERGIHLGVVSNKSGEHLRRESTHLGWDGYFGANLVGATDAARDKPAIDPVIMALQGSGAAPGASVWFVGDTWIDMACARNAGCVAILIGDKDPDDPEFADHWPDLHFPDCRALSELVCRL